MFELLPIPFYIACALVLVFGYQFWLQRQRAWGIPAGVVLATLTVWYLVDAIYNDYANYLFEIGEPALVDAWWQVCLFIVVFGVVVPGVSKTLAGPYVSRRSSILRAISSRQFDSPAMQRHLENLAASMVVTWLLLMSVAIFRVQFDFVGLFAPYLGYKVDPWSRGRMGGGIDAFLSLASYFQIFLTAGFGVLAALLKRPAMRRLAIAICILAFPYYLFDRTRNTMLATLLPGFLAWVFLRLRGSSPQKFALLVLGFLLLSFWFSFVLASRSDSSISQAFGQGIDLQKVGATKHLGLNMYEELAWVNYFIETGAYQVNWGQRYFAEIVNPVPRSLWPGKPLIGIDYAIARGQGGGSDSAAGVFATISTGMIGQGVVNFGRILGPIAAAIIMALWVGVLARQDLIGSPARQMLYVIGLILTFNMGRDITLLVIYPFIFGYIAIRYWENKQSKQRAVGS